MYTIEEFDKGKTKILKYILYKKRSENEVRRKFEKELDENSVVKENLTTAKDGKNYKTKFYNLDLIIAVGYRVKSVRGTQFRIWANKLIKKYLKKDIILM